MRLLLVFFIGVASSAFAGTTDDATPDARYLEYGKGFAPYTCRVTGVGTDGFPLLGTCTLIGERWALTAAHVVSDMTRCHVLTESRLHRVVRIWPHRDFDGSRLGWSDIAIIEAAEPWGLDWYPPLSAGDEAPGDVVSIAGYGMTGRMSAGYTIGDGQLRAGTNRIARFERSIIVCPIRRGGSPLPLGIAPGDSGGPLFVNGRLAGVNSFTMADKGPLRSKAGEESGHTRVSLYLDWIAEVTGQRLEAKPGSVAAR